LNTLFLQLHGRLRFDLIVASRVPKWDGAKRADSKRLDYAGQLVYCCKRQQKECLMI